MITYEFTILFKYLLLKGSLHNKQKLKSIKGKSKNQGNMSAIQCLAISTDNKFLVSVNHFFNKSKLASC
jgi:hypothetical protein